MTEMQHHEEETALQNHLLGPAPAKERKRVEERLLRNYLLALGPAEERKRVEERLLTDSDYCDELERMEECLTDEYVQGEMKGAEREQFDSHFLKSAEHREGLEFARLLDRYFLEQDVARSLSIPPTPKWRRAMEMALASAAIVLMAASAILFRQVSNLHAEAARLEKLAPGSLDVAASLDNLRLVTKYRGDLAKAEQYYHQALEIQEKLAPGSLVVAASLNDLGTVNEYRGDLAKAERYYRQALEIREKLAPGSLVVATSLNSLGLVTEQRGDLAKAEQYHRQALEIREKLAPGSLVAAASLNSLGLVTEQRGDLAKAEQYHRQALEIREKLAPGSLDVAASLNDLGNVAYKRGDLAKAEQYHRQALETQEKLAPGSLNVAQSLNNLGVVIEQQRLAADQRAQSLAGQLAEQGHLIATLKQELAGQKKLLVTAPWDRVVHVLGDPVFDSHDDRLQGAAPEIALLSLSPGLDRTGAKVRRVTIPAHAQVLLLQLKLQGIHYRHYRAQVETVEGEVIWTAGDLAPRPAGNDRHKAIALALPVTLITHSEYLVKVAGITQSGGSESVATYYLNTMQPEVQH
jgi:tetratricopeptide (TPR) repeat protein